MKMAWLAGAFSAVVMLLGAAAAQAEVKIGDTVDFDVTDSAGKAHKASDFRGKTVVLEWKNIGCPFVKKFYDAGEMQKLQKEYTAKDVVWLSVTSSAEGKQGYLTPAEANAQITKEKSAATAWVLDAKGTLGAQFGAKTTPHIFVIGKDGKLAYNGAIDDKATADSKDIAGAKSYLRAAVDATLAGKPVETATTTPYGCSVKY